MFYKLLTFFYYLRAKYWLRFSSRAKLERYQQKQLKHILRYMKTHSPFYHTKNLSERDLSSWPCMDKYNLMTHFDELNTAHIPLAQAQHIAQQAEVTRDFTPQIGKYSVGLSSGTSGIRGVFLISPREQAQWSGTILAKMLPRSIFCKQKIAFFLRADNNLYESVKSRIIQFKFFDLKKPFEQHIATLQSFWPDILVAPPAVLYLLAQAQEQGKLHISPIKIISVADVLYDDVKQYISRIFKQKIHQIYQATEGLIACTCAQGHLHLNEELMFVQQKHLDKNSGRFIPVLTDFNRTTQPIIRYELNDILTLSSKPCPCGNPSLVIECIEGRCDDVLYAPGNPLHPVFPDFIVRLVLQYLPFVGNFQFRQISLTNAQLALPADVKCPPELLAQLKQVLPIQIDVTVWRPDTDLTRKQKRVVREFSV